MIHKFRIVRVFSGLVAMLAVLSACRFESNSTSLPSQLGAIDEENPAPPAFTLPQVNNPTVINMKDAGAKGDGTSDDSAAIQQAIDSARNNSEFYFPSGTYRLHNIEVNNRAKLIFSGDGAATVLQWLGTSSGYTPILTFTNITDLIIQNLSWDNRSIPTYGGVRFYQATRVLIQNTRFVDSAPLPTVGIDRYSYVFGYGATQSADLTIRNNVIEELQLEVDQARRVEIRNNRVTHGTQTAGIGLFTIGDGAAMEDYIIEGNTIVDPRPPACGIAVHLDPPSTNGSTFRRIRIANNTIIHKQSGGIGISIGTTYVLATTHSNVFEDITLEGNTIWADPLAPPQDSAVRLLSNSNFVFERLTVKNNLIFGNQTATPDSDGAFVVRYARNSKITGNTLRHLGNTGFNMSSLEATQLSDNLTETVGYAYAFTNSLGSNFLSQNHYLQSSQAIYYENGPAESDQIEAPLLFVRSGPILGDNLAY
jgi:hypothetical protein